MSAAGGFSLPSHGAFSRAEARVARKQADRVRVLAAFTPTLAGYCLGCGEDRAICGEAYAICGEDCAICREDCAICGGTCAIYRENCATCGGYCAICGEACATYGKIYAHKRWRCRVQLGARISAEPTALSKHIGYLHEQLIPGEVRKSFLAAACPRMVLAQVSRRAYVATCAMIRSPCMPCEP